MKDAWQVETRHRCKECRGTLKYRLEGNVFCFRCKECRREWRVDVIEF